MEQSVLVTGGAGFIGSHLVDELLADGWRVTTLDSFDPQYAEAIKRRNIEAHAGHPRFQLVRSDIRDAAGLDQLTGEFDAIVHLAARAGVRNSLIDPVEYQLTNVIGTLNLLEFARRRGVRRFVFASSSSVYGKCERVPWREDDFGLQPINPYGSSKLAGEHLGHVYNHLYGLTFVALRFFTVYGPRQRPDLAIHKFTRLMLRGEPIPMLGDGTIERDYTYITDITAGVRAALAPGLLGYEIINLGNRTPISTQRMIEALEQALQVKATIERRPADASEMRRTWADVAKAERLLGFRPGTQLDEGLRRFAVWNRDDLARGAA